MKERPILFSGEMVRAILDGRKTQTRRVVKPQPLDGYSCPGGGGQVIIAHNDEPFEFTELNCPYGKPSDRLWVREAWRKRYSDAGPSDVENGIQYKADGLVLCQPKWKPSIHMPRWASRIMLEITGVRVERIRDISMADAIAEGIEPQPNPISGRDWTVGKRFIELWDSINAKRGHSWDSNPWVWVIKFKLTTDERKL